MYKLNYLEQNIFYDAFDRIFGVDAFSFDRLTDDGSKYAFCFYGQSINPKIPCFPVHIVPTIDGNVSYSIIVQMKCLISLLKENRINVFCISLNGDSAYNILNEEKFEIYIISAFENGFDSAVSAWDSFKGDKHISDLLHCLKSVRYRLLTGNITLNCDQIYHLINSKELESVLYFGHTLTDESSVGKMKDNYALKLFNL